MFYLARDKDEKLFLYVGSAPVMSATKDTFVSTDIQTDVIFIDESEVAYPDVTFENSPVQVELKKLEK